MIIQPIILSGGSGTRLWPLSRECYPKQLLPLFGQKTLLQETLLRVSGIEHQITNEKLQLESPILVCNIEHRFLVAEQLRQIGIKSKNIILETNGRNTAPALTLAALSIHDDAIMIIMPADHVIKKVDKFIQAMETAIQLALSNYITVFGIIPVKPEVGYGYIEMGESISIHQNAFSVTGFKEKPNIELASKYLMQGKYLWNSGMFVLKKTTWIRALKQYQSDILIHCQSAYDNGREESIFYYVHEESFSKCANESIDYAVMEKVTNNAANPSSVAVITLDADWSDVGSWSSMWESSTQDNDGNVIIGDVYSNECHNSLICSESRFVATVGLENIIAIETSDAVMIISQDKAQDVKSIVEWLNLQKRTETQAHKRIYRPWGTFDDVVSGNRFHVKRITVNSKSSLSLQMHHHRAEHWVVVRGTAKVTKGDSEFFLTENQSTYIPLGVTHRLENPGTIPLEIIEIQSGSYLGEDDIVRFEDEYGRRM